jgi:membrane protein implicated in regulation of membrane protease activity
MQSNYTDARIPSSVPPSSSRTEEISYGPLLRELGSSTKDLIHSEMNLLTTELKNSAEKIGEHATQAAIFGGILALSVFPFIAFLVIGLGELLGGRYWLSSLIVAVVFALIGAPQARKAYRKIKNEDVDMSRTKANLQAGFEAIQKKLAEVQDAATKGEHHEADRFH